MPGNPYPNIAKARHKTTVAGGVDTLTFSTNFAKAEIRMRIPASGSTGLWVAIGADATDPAAAGDDTEWVSPNVGAKIVVALGRDDVVKVFSATADAYSVRGIA